MGEDGRGASVSGLVCSGLWAGQGLQSQEELVSVHLSVPPCSPLALASWSLEHLLRAVGARLGTERKGRRPFQFPLSSTQSISKPLKNQQFDQLLLTRHFKRPCAFGGISWSGRSHGAKYLWERAM